MNEIKRMKQLAGLITESQLNEVEEEITSSPYEDAISYLEDLSLKGELTPDQIQNIIGRLSSARKKFFTSKRSPDSYKTAAEKAKLTKDQNKSTAEKTSKEDAEKEILRKADIKKREDAGLLPLTVGYFRGYNEIDPKWLKYYNKQENTNPDNDRVTYNIKGEFINTKPLGGTPIPYSSLFKK